MTALGSFEVAPLCVTSARSWLLVALPPGGGEGCQGRQGSRAQETKLTGSGGPHETAGWGAVTVEVMALSEGEKGALSLQRLASVQAAGVPSVPVSMHVALTHLGTSSGVSPGRLSASATSLRARPTHVTALCASGELVTVSLRTGLAHVVAKNVTAASLPCPCGILTRDA